jgi:N-acetylmuramoyl-L-alanine amidase
MTEILGRPVATAQQMAAYLLSVNPNPKINMPPLQFCQLFLNESAKEGVRGDALFAQSCKETGFFKYGGTVTPDQNNYAGLGTVNVSTQGAYFKTEAVGILAQAQHARAYATRNGLCEPCVDPRYELLVRYGKTGTAKHWEDLGGKWAVPGYDTKKYSSLADANKAKDSYGYQIIEILEKILKMPKGEKQVGKIIALDAGHGMNTVGKRCMEKFDPSRTREWYLNDRIMDLVEIKLRNYDCVVLRVDDTTGVKDVSLAARVNAANNAKADMYISMHHNAGLNGRDGGGTQVYYYSSDANRKNQAQTLYNYITARTRLYGNRASKVVKQAFYVIKNTKMPAFLVENGFMDSPDVHTIITQSHADKTADGVVAFLVKELSLQQGPTNTQANTYPAYTGKKTTLTIALQSLGIEYSYAYRKKIAAVNGITRYSGTVAQNTQMYNLLVAGLLKRV